MSREIDALVGNHVFGYPIKIEENLPFIGTRTTVGVPISFFGKWDGESRLFVSPKEYSSDIAAAWEVVEAVKKRGYAFLLHDAGSEVYCDGCKTFKKPTAIFQPIGGDSWGRFEEESDSVPMAICLAALKALGVPVAPQGEVK